MGRIIPHISKTRLGQALSYPLSFSDLETCFADRNEGDIYLGITFWAGRNYSHDHRRERIAQGYHLLRCEYDPDPASLAPAGPTLPWHNIDNPTVIEVSIGAVPRDILRTTGVTRPQMQEWLKQALDQMLPNGFPSPRWELELVLFPAIPQLKRMVTVWKGLKPHLVTQHIPLVERVAE